MALRLIELILKQADGKELEMLLKDSTVLENRQISLPDDEVLVRILLDAEDSEAVLDILDKRFSGQEGHRIVVLPVEATLPRDEPDEFDATEKAAPEEKSPERISREELYEDIKDAARFTHVYSAMVLLSTVLAATGLYYNSVTIIIGAMVIAPLLGPNVALSLATTLGDLALLRQALLTLLAGIGIVILLSVTMGALLEYDPASTEVASRTRVAMGDIVVALASGCAGTLAFTSGVSATLIGVMVAVALLPPLVTFGLMLGGGDLALAVSALLLFLMNLICINLAGVTTFFLQGIHPVSWWEKSTAKKATSIAIGLWMTMLLAMAAMIWFMRQP
jgi:uncharacterized hydrophobic protein (TIGR00341 family)